MNNSLTQMLMNYAPLIVLFVLGWFFGSRHERQHLVRLKIAEKELSHIIVSTERFYVPKLAANTEGELVMGSVVIAQDYFKMVIARWLMRLGPMSRKRLLRHRDGFDRCTINKQLSGTLRNARGRKP